MTGKIRKTTVIIGIVFWILLLVCNYIIPMFMDREPLFRFYRVLTNSMEPLITPDSLVCVKEYDGEAKLKENDIITFRANRFGEIITITHRYSHTEVNENGEIIYRTHPEASEVLDVYETTQEDILGVYLFHLPYGAKILLFFKSMFGVLWVCEVVTILLIKKMILARWAEQESESASQIDLSF